MGWISNSDVYDVIEGEDDPILDPEGTFSWENEVTWDDIDAECIERGHI